MALRCKLRTVLLCLAGLCVSSFLLAVYAPGYDSCNCELNAGVALDKNKHGGGAVDHPEWGPHKLAVIVPFRNRFEELMEFAPHLNNFLNTQKIRHKIFVINQADGLRFNRASLINVGYIQSRLECDYIAMHDVDLLPLNPQLNYSYPSDGLFHVAAPELHPMYHYKTFVGGILLVNNKHFHEINGLSNNFWGWGREDDEFYLRIKDAGLTVRRPTQLKTTAKNTFRHIHDKYSHPRDYSRFGQQRQNSKRDHFTGIDTVEYGLMSRKEILIEGAPVTVLNVKLECDIERTPWCMVPEQIQIYLKDLGKKDPERASELTEKLFGPNGLLIPPPKSDPPKKKLASTPAAYVPGSHNKKHDIIR